MPLQHMRFLAHSKSTSPETVRTIRSIDVVKCPLQKYLLERKTSSTKLSKKENRNIYLLYISLHKNHLFFHFMLQLFDTAQ